MLLIFGLTAAAIFLHFSMSSTCGAIFEVFKINWPIHLESQLDIEMLWSLKFWENHYHFIAIYPGTEKLGSLNKIFSTLVVPFSFQFTFKFPGNRTRSLIGWRDIGNHTQHTFKKYSKGINLTKKGNHCG